MRRLLLSIFAAFASVASTSSSAEEAPKQQRPIHENTLGMKLVRIEPGEFVMGSPESEDTHKPDELQHKVRISRPFYMGQHEVTVGQFRKFAEATKHVSTLEKEKKPGFGYDVKQNAMEISTEFNWHSIGFNQTDRHPVANLSWDDATAFCRWLSEQEKREYRLPTEAEWEYCCRAGTTTRFVGGEDEESLIPYANVSDAAFRSKYPDASWAVEWDDKHPFSAPVGSLKANPWGLHDMHGNVWEWCSDWYGADYFKNSPAVDPKGPETGTKRVLRGGSFTNRFRFIRSADRDADSPKYRYNFTGFRVVLAPSDSK